MPGGMQRGSLNTKRLLIAMLGLGITVDGGAMPRGWWRHFSRRRSTPPPITRPPTTTPLQGCEYNGQIYPPGSEFDKGYDEGINWCYGAFCTQRGQIVYWDNFNCKTTSTTTTTPLPTTGAPAVRSMVTEITCEYNGQQYPANWDIDSGYDSSSDWCYGTHCDDNGHVVAWDKWNCKNPTTAPTIAPTKAPTTAPTSTPPVSASEGTEQSQESSAGETRSEYNEFEPLNKLLRFLRLKKLLDDTSA